MTASIRVLAGPDANSVSAYARNRRFVVGGPVAFDEGAQAVSALEYALAAIGAEIVYTLTRLARRRRVPIDATEAVVQGSLENDLVLLEVVGEEGTPMLADVLVKLYVVTSADEPEIRALLERTLELSPLCLALAPIVRVDVAISP